MAKPTTLSELRKQRLALVEQIGRFATGASTPQTPENPVNSAVQKPVSRRPAQGYRHTLRQVRPLAVKTG